MAVTPPTPQEPTGWAAVLRRNVGAKVFAAVIGFGLWLFVNAGQREIEEFQFPIEIVNLPENAMVVNNDRRDTVTVKLNGPGPLLASLDPRRLPIRLDLSALPVGPAMRRKIRGVRILDVEPSRVPIRLEAMTRRKVPIDLTQMGKPREGYRIREIEIVPREVTVTGPESVVTKLTAIETEPLDLAAVEGAAQRTLSLVRTHPLINVTPGRVTVNVQMEQILETRKFGRVAVTVRNVDRPFRLRPTHVKLTVRGPQAAVAALTLPEGGVSVDGAGYRPGTHTVEPTAQLPSGVTVVAWEPASVELEIQESTTTKNGAQK
jgi:YbbR domain-containing protein